MVSPAFAPSKVPFLIASSPAWISPPSLKRVMIPIAIHITTIIGPTNPIASTKNSSPPATVIAVKATKITAPIQRGSPYS